MSRAQRDRLDDVENRLAAARAVLRDAYARWERTLEDAENLYAIAAWREEAEESPARPQTRAA
jgi:hypothetical protein